MTYVQGSTSSVHTTSSTQGSGPADQPSSTVNINGAATVILYVMDQMQQALNLLLYNNSQMAAGNSQAETYLNEYFYTCEHSETNPIQKGKSADETNDPGTSDPSDAGYNFQNCMYAISHDTGDDKGATLWGPIYNDDNSHLQTFIKAYDQITQEWQTQMNANGQNQASFVQMGSSVTSIAQTMSRLLG